MTHIKTMVRTSLPLLYLAPTLLLNDNIRFEDFLGRKFSLPYEWFSKWPVRGIPIIDDIQLIFLRYLRDF